MDGKDRINSVVVNPTLFILKEDQSIQISVHQVGSQSFINEVSCVFPGLNSLKEYNSENLLVIPTMQKALMDLVQIGEDVEREKDRLLQNVRMIQPL